MNIVFVFRSYGSSDVYDASTPEKMKKCVDKVYSHYYKDFTYDKIMKNIQVMTEEHSGMSWRRLIMDINRCLSSLCNDDCNDIQRGTAFYVVDEL